MSGLPHGITWDGVARGFDGVTTKRGLYTVIWQVFDKKGLADTCRSIIVVDDPLNPLPIIRPGLYAGNVYGSTYKKAPALASGILELQMSSNGAYTGLLRLGMHRWPLTGILRLRNDIFSHNHRLTPPRGVARLELKISADGEFNLSPEFRVELIDSTQLASGESAPPMSCELHSARDPKLTDRVRHKGMVTAIIECGVTDGSEFALGNGFMSMKPVQNFGRLNVIGTMPDGSGIAGSMPVVGGYGVNLIFNVPHPQNNGLLMGTLNISSNAWDGMRNDLVRGNLLWELPANSKRRFLAGRQISTLASVRGELYFQPTARPLLQIQDEAVSIMSLSAGNAFSSMFEQTDVPFQLLPNHRSLFPADDQRDFKMDIYAPTGFFTGQFKLFEIRENGAKTFQLVHFRGMIIPGLGLGGGFFHFRSPGTSASQSQPFYSGSLSLDAGWRY